MKNRPGDEAIPPLAQPSPSHLYCSVRVTIAQFLAADLKLRPAGVESVLYHLHVWMCGCGDVDVWVWGCGCVGVGVWMGGCGGVDVWVWGVWMCGCGRMLGCVRIGGELCKFYRSETVGNGLLE